MKNYNITVRFISLFFALLVSKLIVAQVAFQSVNPSLRLEYRTQGDPNGEPLILLHGYADSWHSFETVLPFLPSSFKVYAISLRGHGGSDKPDSTYTPEVFAQDIYQFMQSQGIPKAWLLGHSLGASVVQCFAIKYPDKVRGILLAGGFASFNENKQVAELEPMIEQLQDPVDTAFIRAFQSSGMVKPVPSAHFNELLKESAKLPAYVWKATMKGMLPVDFTRELGSIRVPALIIWGDKDGFAAKADQDRFMQQIRNAQLIVYAGNGHALHWESPAIFANDISNFIKKHQ